MAQPTVADITKVYQDYAALSAAYASGTPLTGEQLTKLTTAGNQLRGWATGDSASQQVMTTAMQSMGSPDPVAAMNWFSNWDMAKQTTLGQPNNAPGTPATTPTTGTTPGAPTSTGLPPPGSTGAAGGGGGTANIGMTIAERQASQSATTGVATTYVDMPTPAEFLDQFQNDFAMHIQGLQQSGAITAGAAAFAQQNMGQFYSSYMRQQLTNLFKGQPLFRVSGINPNEKVLGERPGMQQTTNTNMTTQQAYNLGENINTSGNISPNEAALSGSFATRGLPIPQAAGGNALERLGLMNPASGTTALNISETAGTTQQQQQQTNMMEKLVSRNKLGVVANLAPLDFLKTGATAQQINFMYEGQKGRAQAEAQSALGQGVSQAVRRVG